MQLSGNSPVQTILLGEFAFEELRTQKLNKLIRRKRQNITIVLELFENNSAKIIIKTYDWNEEFFLMQMPFDFDIFSIKVINNKREQFVFLKTDNCVLLSEIKDEYRIFLIE